MTAKAKAEYLVKHFKSLNLSTWINNKDAKKCALISVEQVRFFHDSLFYLTKGSLLDQYLDDVKREIENL
jgi:hypothetical protein